MSSVIFSNSTNTPNEGIAVKSNTEIVEQISYKENKIGVAYGYLRKSTSENISKKKFSITDIVIIDKLENDKFPYFVSALIVGKDMRKEDVKLNTEVPMMTYKDAYVSVDEFMERYNKRRIHSSLGYMTPEEFYNLYSGETLEWMTVKL